MEDEVFERNEGAGEREAGAGVVEVRAGIETVAQRASRQALVEAGDSVFGGGDSDQELRTVERCGGARWCYTNY